MRDTHFVTNTTGRPLFRSAFRCASIARHAPVGLYNSPVTIDRPPRPPRAETREIVELKQLKIEQPELAAAVDMQVALVDMQRRVQSRVPLPWIQVDPDWQTAQQAAGRPLVRFKD